MHFCACVSAARGIVSFVCLVSRMILDFVAHKAVPSDATAGSKMLLSTSIGGGGKEFLLFSFIFKKPHLSELTLLPFHAFQKPYYSDVNCFWCQNLKLFTCAFENTPLCISEKDSKACYLSSLHWKQCLRLLVPGVDVRRCVCEIRQQRIFALTGRRRVSVSVNISMSWETSSRPPASSPPVTMAKISISSSTCKPAAT